MIRAIVLDIEGTTSALSVLKEVLAPYARAQLRPYLRSHQTPEVEEALAAARVLAEEPDADRERTIGILERWIDEDRKAPPLKTLQGLIWERGYRDGSLRAHVYPDVAPALRGWREAGYALYVYSSGSVLAQRLFFEHTLEGDLRGYFSGWFDTRVGPKHSPTAYRAIAQALSLHPQQIAFLSDAQAELDAATEVGFYAYGVAREGNPPIRGRVVHDFSQTSMSAIARLVALTRYCSARGWVEATSGNLSLRLDGAIAITASGRDKSALSIADIAWVDEAARPRAGSQKPSAETSLHCALYRARHDVNAVAHTHSVACTVLSRRYLGAGVLILSGFEMQKALAGVGTHEQSVPIPVVANAQDMTVLAARIDEALARFPTAPAYLVAGHGLTTWGSDAATVKRQLEALEFLFACRLAEDQSI
ncbi:MAG TPA: acireductone synthase [Polyangiales bacterium]